MRKNVILLVVILLSLASTVSAAPTQQDTPVTLRVALPAPEALDPVQISRFAPHTHDLVENLFVGLTRFDPQTNEAEPMLAKSWTISDDGLTWTFELRDDVQWVRYDPITQAVTPVRPVAAGDFVFAIQRACNPLRPSPVTANLMVVKGCYTVANAFPSAVDDLFIAREMGVRATGPNTLVIDLLYPASFLPALLSTPEFRPLPREAVVEDTNWTAAETIITNGPFALSAWDNTGLTLLRNPHWPDALAGDVERVEAVFMPEEQAAAQVAAGEIDLARLGQNAIPAAQRNYADLLQRAPNGTLVLLGFSPERTIVNDPTVRRALALAIDREALVATYFPTATAINQFAPANVIAAPDVTNPVYDAAQAQADFEAAGYPGCSNMPEKITIMVPNDDPLWASVGQFIADQWGTTLGCNPALFTVQPVLRTVLVEMSHATYDAEEVERPHAWLITWTGDYPDANAWLSDTLHCQYGYFRIGRTCNAADMALDQAATLTDTAQRAEQYAQAETSFFGPNGSYPVAPLVAYVTAWVQRPGLDVINPARLDLVTAAGK